MGLFDFLFGKGGDNSEKRFTETVSLQSLYKKSISFHVDRYEEWQTGRCISQGSLNFNLHLRSDGSSISVNIPESSKFRMHSHVSFPFTGSQILHDRLQYLNPPVGGTDSTQPIILHVFVKDGRIDYIRFAMSFPDRIVEFYGYQIEN